MSMTTYQAGNAGKRPLGNLGISETEEHLYRWLLSHPGASAQQISEALPFGLRKIQQVLNSLEIVGFISHSPERPRRYIPAEPDIAVTVLMRHRREELEDALRVVPDLRKQAAEGMSSHEQVVELITSQDAVRHILKQIPEAAQEEIITFTRMPVLVSDLNSTPEKDHPSQRESQARGVSYRSIVDSTVLESPDSVRFIRADMQAGEDIRVVPHLPFKMVLADRHVALIPLRPDQADSPSLLLRSSSLLDALYFLFEMLWERASPFSFAATGEMKIDEITSSVPDLSDLIGLLSAGMNDKSIVQEMGISRRTLLRRVSELMEFLGARTRFQAGWLSALRFYESEGREKAKK